jgi:hypothetical protein
LQSTAPPPRLWCGNKHSRAKLLTQRVQVKKPNWSLPRVEARVQTEGAATAARHSDVGGSGGGAKLPEVEGRGGLKRMKAVGEKEVVRFR